MRKSKQNESVPPNMEIPIVTEIKSDKIIFCAAEFSFSMSRDEFLSILDQNVMRNRFDALDRVNMVSDPESLERGVRIGRLLSKGLNSSEVAAVLGEKDETIRLFWGNFIQANRKRPGLDEIRKRQAEEDMDFIPDLKRSIHPDEETLEVQKGIKPEIIFKFVSCREVKNLQNRGLLQNQICKELNLDEKEFSHWFERNQQYLDVMK